MTLRKTLLPTLFLFCFLFACKKWDLEEKSFIRVEITSVEALSIDSVRLSGVIKDLSVGQIVGHGFLWAKDGKMPNILFNDGRLHLGVKTREEGPSFSAVVQLSPKTSYTFLAYATIDEEDYAYSAAEQMQTGTGSIMTLEVDYQRGLSLDVSGQLLGTEKGIFAVKHGFCWSSTVQEPTLKDDFINLGTRVNNDIFTYTLEGLQNNTPLNFRAFAILSYNFQQDTAYGEVLPFDGDLNFWTRKTDFGGGLRWNARGFTIGQKAYIGTGHDGLYNKKDLWEYDPVTNSWAQKADLPGVERTYAVSFSIGQKGYIGTGRYISSYVKDFWEYDPQFNSWAQIPDFPGGDRAFAVGFSIGQKGYVGMGFANSGAIDIRKDLWEFDPASNTWSRKGDFPGKERGSAAGFSIGQKGYVGAGFSADFEKDFWEYDPATDAWERKADFPAVARHNAAGFSIGQKGYLGTGGGAPNEIKQKDFWEFDPQANTWTRKAEFPGGERMGVFGFSIGPKGYFCMGLSNVAWEKDFWEFDP